jgi:hypothetical protein
MLDKRFDKCTICNDDIRKDEAVLEGYFGELPVTFCEFCFLSVLDMAEEHFFDDTENMVIH